MIVYFLGDYHHVVIIRVNTIEQIYNMFENVRRLNLSLFKGLPQQTSAVERSAYLEGLSTLMNTIYD